MNIEGCRRRLSRVSSVDDMLGAAHTEGLPNLKSTYIPSTLYVNATDSTRGTGIQTKTGKSETQAIKDAAHRFMLEGIMLKDIDLAKQADTDHQKLALLLPPVNTLEFSTVTEKTNLSGAFNAYRDYHVSVRMIRPFNPQDYFDTILAISDPRELVSWLRAVQLTGLSVKKSFIYRNKEYTYKGYIPSLLKRYVQESVPRFFTIADTFCTTLSFNILAAARGSWDEATLKNAVDTNQNSVYNEVLNKIRYESDQYLSKITAIVWPWTTSQTQPSQDLIVNLPLDTTASTVNLAWANREGVTPIFSEAWVSVKSALEYFWNKAWERGPKNALQTLAQKTAKVSDPLYVPTEQEKKDIHDIYLNTSLKPVYDQTTGKYLYTIDTSSNKIIAYPPKEFQVSALEAKYYDQAPKILDQLKLDIPQPGQKPQPPSIPAEKNVSPILIAAAGVLAAYSISKVV